MSDTNIEGSTGSASPTAEPRHLRRVIIIWVVLSVIVIAIWLVVAQISSSNDCKRFRHLPDPHV